MRFTNLDPKHPNDVGKEETVDNQFQKANSVQNPKFRIKIIGVEAFFLASQINTDPGPNDKVGHWDSPPYATVKPKFGLRIKNVGYD